MWWRFVWISVLQPGVFLELLDLIQYIMSICHCLLQSPLDGVLVFAVFDILGSFWFICHAKKWAVGIVVYLFFWQIFTGGTLLCIPTKVPSNTVIERDRIGCKCLGTLGLKICLELNWNHNNYVVLESDSLDWPGWQGLHREHLLCLAAKADFSDAQN